MEKFVLSIDQGTTSTRAILFDREGKPRYSAVRAVECLYPKPGWVEQNPIQLFVSVCDVINEVLIVANISMDEIVFLDTPTIFAKSACDNPFSFLTMETLFFNTNDSFILPHP